MIIAQYYNILMNKFIASLWFKVWLGKRLHHVKSLWFPFLVSGENRTLSPWLGFKTILSNTLMCTCRTMLMNHFHAMEH